MRCPSCRKIMKKNKECATCAFCVRCQKTAQPGHMCSEKGLDWLTVLKRVAGNEHIGDIRLIETSGLQMIGHGSFAEVYRKGDSVLKLIDAGRLSPSERKTLVSETLIGLHIEALPPARQWKDDDSLLGYTKVQLVINTTGSDALNKIRAECYGNKDKNEATDKNLAYKGPVLIIHSRVSGTRLEKFKLKYKKEEEKDMKKTILPWVSVLAQTTVAVLVAEKRVGLEHRDLYEGNVLLKPTAPTAIRTYEIDGKAMSLMCYGVRAEIVDYTYSRCRTTATIESSPMVDPAFYDPECCRSTVYTTVRDNLSGHWNKTDERNNAVWVAYLATFIAKEKINEAPEDAKAAFNEMIKAIGEAPNLMCILNLIRKHYSQVEKTEEEQEDK